MTVVWKTSSSPVNHYFVISSSIKCGWCCTIFCHYKQNPQSERSRSSHFLIELMDTQSSNSAGNTFHDLHFFFAVTRELIIKILYIAFWELTEQPTTSQNIFFFKSISEIMLSCHPPGNMSILNSKKVTNS